MSRFFNKRKGRLPRWARILALSALILAVIAAALVTSLYLYLDSDQFREQARRLVEEALSRQTGAAVSLGRFEWDLGHKRFHLEDVTLRGSEPRDGPPLAHIERVDAGVRLRDLLSRRAHLTELIIERPQIFLLVGEDGKTNIPVLKSRSPDLKLDYVVSIDDFKIVGGTATINARPIDIDFAITRLNSALKYRGNTGVLSGQLRFDGTAQPEGYSAIPYALTASFDYTAGSVLTHGIEIKTAESFIKAQGLIDHVLTPDIKGQLEYTGVADTSFLKQFFERDRLEGKADVTGRVEFSKESFSTSGTMAASRIALNEWTATALAAQFAYEYPEGRLAISQLRADTVGGTIEGSLALAREPAPTRVTVDLRYRNIDTAELERVYPWDHQYRIYSRLNGAVAGWFEGRFEKYLLEGNAKLTSYPARAIPGTVALPVDGEGAFSMRPESVTVRNGRGRFFSTAVEADGVIGTDWNMKVKLTSTDLHNLFFIYKDSNGSGEFDGTLSGPIKTPTAAGTFNVSGHKYGEWIIERVAGNARLDTGAGTAELTDVRVTEGTSSVSASGTVALNGESADLRFETARVAAEDAGKFDSRIAEHLRGAFSAKGRLTSLRPIRLEADIKGRDLILDNRPIGDAEAHVRYSDPVAELSNLNVKRGAATVTGTASYNTQTESVTFNVAAQSVDLDTIRDLGIPAGVTGIVERGRFTGGGVGTRLSVDGKDVVFREGHGGVVTGDLGYAADTDALRAELTVTSSLNLDVLRNAWADLKIPASLAGTVVERGRFSVSGTTRAVAFTGTNVSIRESHGATMTGNVAYNMGTDAMTFNVDVASIQLDLVRDIARDTGRILNVPASLTGTIVESGHFSGSGTATRPTVTATNLTIRDGHGASVTGELAYNASADTLTFEMNVMSLGIGFLNDVRPDSGLPANVLNGAVIDRGHFSGSGSASQPVVTGRNVTIRESHGAVLTGDLAYNTGADKLSFDLSVAKLDLDSIRDMGLPENLTGTIERGRLTGDIVGKQPNVEGSATLRNLMFFGEEFPIAEITIPRSGGSKIPVTLSAGSLNLSLEVDTTAPGYPFTGSGSFTRYPVEKLARLRDETLRLTGRADHLEGLLTDPTRVRGSGRIESAEMQVQGRELKSTGPFTFDFTHDRATFSGISLVGDGTALNVEGTVSLTDKETIDLKVNGTVDLGLLTAQTDWPASGALDLNGRVGGTIQDRNLFGIATLKNATVAPKGNLLGNITNVNGEVFFNGNNVRFDNVTGNIGVGKVQVQGEATIGKDQIDSMNVRILADGVRVFYPEGLRTVADGALALRGSWADPLLEGNLQIRNMSYQAQFEKFLELIETPGALGNRESLLSRLNLSIHVEGNRNISIKNELTEAQARVSLDIRGTVGAPSITGHVEARGGTLSFQGRQYEITRGNIDFVNPFVIEPIVDVQAEADLRNYRVILAITGRGDKIRFEMRSDPPLPELEVFSLITGGKSREELLESSAQNGGVSSELMFPTAAAAVLTELVKNRVGGSLGLLGLQRFRIDPLPIGSEKNALARITVPVQVSKDLLITYSQDLSTSAQIILSIEYFVSKDISILATVGENGALSLDIKRRQRF